MAGRGSESVPEGCQRPCRHGPVPSCGCRRRGRCPGGVRRGGRAGVPGPRGLRNLHRQTGAARRPGGPRGRPGAGARDPPAGPAPRPAGATRRGRCGGPGAARPPRARAAGRAAGRGLGRRCRRRSRSGRQGCRPSRPGPCPGRCRRTACPTSRRRPAECLSPCGLMPCIVPRGVPGTGASGKSGHRARARRAPSPLWRVPSRPAGPRGRRSSRAESRSATPWGAATVGSGPPPCTAGGGRELPGRPWRHPGRGAGGVGMMGAAGLRRGRFPPRRRRGIEWRGGSGCWGR